MKVFTHCLNSYEIKQEVCTIRFIEINWGKYRILRGEIMEAEQPFPCWVNTVLFLPSGFEAHGCLIDTAHESPEGGAQTLSRHMRIPAHY